MTAENFPNVLPVILVNEGGFSIVHSDPGNWTGGKVGKGVLKGTKKGVAASAHPTLDIKNLTDAEIETIYASEYWVPSTASVQPNGLDLTVFDEAVNSGVSRAKSTLVKAKTVDGTVAQIHKFADIRLSFLRGLATFKTFGKGWAARVAVVEAKSVRMASGVAAPAVLTTAAATQTAKKVAKTKAAIAGPATATAATTGAATTHGLPHSVIAVIIVVLVVSAIVGGVLAWQHGVRAAAMTAEAAKK